VFVTAGAMRSGRSRSPFNGRKSGLEESCILRILIFSSFRGKNSSGRYARSKGLSAHFHKYSDRRHGPVVSCGNQGGAGVPAGQESVTGTEAGATPSQERRPITGQNAIPNL
jgi:hypothetical protein